MKRNEAMPIIQTALIALGKFATDGVVIGARATTPVSPMAVISGISIQPRTVNRSQALVPSEIDVTILLESPADKAEEIEYQMGDLVTETILAIAAIAGDKGHKPFKVERSDAPGGPFPSIIDGDPWRVERIIITVRDGGVGG